MLWVSPSARPDLGGREEDDNRVLSEVLCLQAQVQCMHSHRILQVDDVSVEVSEPGLYSHVSVELSMNRCDWCVMSGLHFLLWDVQSCGECDSSVETH